MNKIYKSIWNESLGCWVAASEAVRGKTKSSRAGVMPALALTVLGAMALTGVASAQVVGFGPWSGTANSNTPTTPINTAVYDGSYSGSTNVTGNAIVTLTGNASAIDNSAPAAQQTVSADTAFSLQPGAFTIAAPGTDTPAQALARNALYYGNSSQTITVPDPINGGSATFAVIPTASFFECNVGCNAVALFTPSNGTEYVNTRLGQVDNAGGKLNIAIDGDGLGALRQMPAKQSSLFFADGTGATPSTLNFTGNNLRLDLGSITLNAAVTAPSLFATNVVTYTGTLVYDASHTFSINTLADVRSYNDFLITQLQSGALQPSQYNAKLQLAFSFAASQVRYTAGGGISSTDQLFLEHGTVSVFHATGANGFATVAPGASLTIRGADAGVLFAENGATVTNAGQLNEVGSGDLNTGAGNTIGMNIVSGSHGLNAGVLNAGFDAAGGAPATVTNSGAAFGVNVAGGSSFVNTGIINEAAASQGDYYQITRAIQVSDAGSTAVNNGVINVAVNAGPLRYFPDYGVIVSDSASFVNNGTVYVGRGPQYDAAAPEASADVAAKTVLDAVYVSGGGSAINNGTLTLGSLTENATGMVASGAGNTVINAAAGVINVNGNAGNAASPPGQNVAMAAYDAGNSSVQNAGTINLNGKNALGLYVIADANNTSTASSSGTINVAGGIDPATSLRNYGIWAEGTSTNAATAVLTGAVNLTGDHAIGVHARNNAAIDVDGAGTVNFQSGTDQIGYYIYGAQAKVNLSGTNADVTTSGSELFRIASGAQFAAVNAGGAPLTIGVSGAGAVGVLATGAGSAASTNGATFTVSGAGGTAVAIEGGASGNISAATTINLNGPNTIAGVVDGQAHDLTGAVLGAPVATTLDAATSLFSSSTGVTGYIARNLGQLNIITGSTIALGATDSVGVDVQQGGRLSNAGVIDVAGGVGIRASGSDAQVQRLGTINVTTGIAGVQLLNSAALTAGAIGDTITTAGTANGVLLDTGAVSLDLTGTTITAAGTGAGIENKAEIGAVKLTGVTINTGNGAAIRTATSFDPVSTAALNVTGSGTGLAFQQYATGADVATDLNVGAGYAIHVSGAGGTGIAANTTGKVTTAGSVDVSNAAGGAALAAHDVASITNTGNLTSASLTASAVVDASGTVGKTIGNSGTVTAANPALVAILGGSGADTINLTGGAVSGVVRTGDGTDTVNLIGGTFAGAVEEGNGAGNRTLVDGVSLASTTHLTNGTGGAGTLELSTVSRNIGSLTADDVARGTNIGSNWNQLSVTQGADVRIVDALVLAGTDSKINVGNTAILRVGGAGTTAGTVSDHDIADNGTVVFDNLDNQTYSGVVSGSGAFTRAGTGTSILTGANSYTGTTTIDAGGTLQLGNGGTTGALSGGGAIVDNGALVVDRGNAMTLASAVSGSGTLAQTGTGTTTLTGASSYSGATNVTAGTLLVNGNQAAATGAVTVASGATLGGTGITGGIVTVQNGGTLAPGANGVGVLTTGGLDLAPAATLSYEFGQANVVGGTLNDRTQVNGNVLLDGTVNVATPAGGTFGPGVYRVIDYTGGLTNNTLDVGAVPVGQVAGKVLVQTSVANQVNLINQNGIALSVWDGPGTPNDSAIQGGSGVWQAGTGNSNWTQFGNGSTTVDGQVNAPFANDSFAIFHAGSGAVTVDNGAATGGQVQIGGMQFEVGGYTIGGGALQIGTTPSASPTEIRVGAFGSGDAALRDTIDSVIQGTGGLEKTAGGTLVLGGTNSYTGGTKVSGGTLQISNDANLGATGTGNALSLNSGSLQLGADVAGLRDVALIGVGGSVDVNGHQGTVAGALSGPGMLLVKDSDAVKGGLLTLTQAGTYTGGTVINGGSHTDLSLTTLQVKATDALGTGPVDVQHGVLLFSGPGVSAGSLAIAASATGNQSAMVSFGNGASAGNAAITNSKRSYVTFAAGTTADKATIQNNGGFVSFLNATAAQSTIDNIGGTVVFLDSDAGSARLSNTAGGSLMFAGASNAATSTIGNGVASALKFSQTADAGTAAIANAGTVSFSETANASNATIAHAAGGLVDISQTTTGTSIGSLNGAGNVALGGKQLTLGNLGLADTLSGVISDGGGAIPATGGSLVKIGTGVLALSGANSYTGATTVAGGTLSAAAVNTLSAASAHTVNAGATLDLMGHDQTVASLVNAGTVVLGGAQANTALTVKGAYVGQGGTLALNTVLNATGPSDRLVLDGAGASASGNTNVAVTNLGGLGAQTAGNGIQVVAAQNGATSTKSAFTLNGGHVDAGAFQYRLFTGDTAGSDSWYLRSDAVVLAPDGSPVSGGGTAVAPQPAYREEVALNAALPNVVRQADLAMLSTLHRRVGDENRPIAADDTDKSTQGWGGDNRRAWGRVLGGSLDTQLKGVAGVDSHTNQSGFQTGVDLYGTSTWSAGLYTGMLRSTGTVYGNVGGLLNSYAGHFETESHYLGAYGTYVKNGFYTDLVLQYGMHDVTATAPRTGSTGDANSMTASVEAGKSFAIGSGWAIEPQAQLIYNRVSFDSVGITGATIQQDAANQVIGRLGVRLTGDVQTSLGRLQPYGRINLWHGFSGNDTTNFAGPAGSTAIGTKIGYTTTELAAGFTLKLTPTTSVYGEVGKMFKAGGENRVKSSVEGSVGVKLNF